MPVGVILTWEKVLSYPVYLNRSKTLLESIRDAAGIICFVRMIRIQDAMSQIATDVASAVKSKFPVESHIGYISAHALGHPRRRSDHRLDMLALYLSLAQPLFPSQPRLVRRYSLDAVFWNGMRSTRFGRVAISGRRPIKAFKWTRRPVEECERASLPGFCPSIDR